MFDGLGFLDQRCFFQRHHQGLQDKVHSPCLIQFFMPKCRLMSGVVSYDALQKSVFCSQKKSSPLEIQKFSLSNSQERKDESTFPYTLHIQGLQQWLINNVQRRHGPCDVGQRLRTSGPNARTEFSKFRSILFGYKVITKIILLQGFTKKMLRMHY